MLRRLRLLRFRCHERLEFAPAPGRNWLVGKNGRGKTSILEAAYYLGRLRSFRTGQPRELAQAAEGRGTGFAVEADVELGGRAETLAVRWDDGVRTWTVGEDRSVPVEEFWNRLPAVLFSAEDAVLVRGPAAKRQGWLDGLRSAAVPAHLVAVQRYNAVLRQRNAWLRQGAGDTALGETLTHQLLAQGRVVTEGRVEAARAAHRLAEPLLEKFFGGTEVCRYRYRPNLREGSASEWPRLLESERRLQRSLIGPHRDEWEIMWKGKAVSRFGSEGEQRLAALLLRLVEAAQLREARGEWPLFLVDDALTPLDPERKLTWEALLPPDAQLLQAGTVPPESCPGPRDAVWSVAPGACVREPSS